MCPLYVAGLIGPGDRKSVQPMAERFAPGNYDQLHHFVSAGVWDAAPLEAELLIQADRVVGGSNAMLVIDDTAVPKKGQHSVGVAPQYGFIPGQDRQLPNTGVANACARRSAGDGCVAPFPSRELDE
jgi:SRSO17 transposase